MLQSQFIVIVWVIIQSLGFFTQGLINWQGTPATEEVHMFTAWEKKSIFLDFCGSFLSAAYCDQLKTGIVGFYNYCLSILPKLNLLSLQVKRYFFFNKCTPHVPQSDVSGPILIFNSLSPTSNKLSFSQITFKTRATKREVNHTSTD